MSNIENNANSLYLQGNDYIQKTDLTEKNNKLMITLAALTGIVGTATVGMNLTGLQTDSISQFASLVVPGLFAWIVSYLLYQNNGSDTSGADLTNIEIKTMLPETGEEVSATATMELLSSLLENNLDFT